MAMKNMKLRICIFFPFVSALYTYLRTFCNYRENLQLCSDGYRSLKKMVGLVNKATSNSIFGEISSRLGLRFCLVLFFLLVVVIT